MQNWILIHKSINPNGTPMLLEIDRNSMMFQGSIVRCFVRITNQWNSTHNRYVNIEICYLFQLGELSHSIESFGNCIDTSNGYIYSTHMIIQSPFVAIWPKDDQLMSIVKYSQDVLESLSTKEVNISEKTAAGISAYKKMKNISLLYITHISIILILLIVFFLVPCGTWPGVILIISVLIGLIGEIGIALHMFFTRGKSEIISLAEGRYQFENESNPVERKRLWDLLISHFGMITSTGSVAQNGHMLRLAVIVLSLSLMTSDTARNIIGQIPKLNYTICTISK
jgi:hypothetical protein